MENEVVVSPGRSSIRIGCLLLWFLASMAVLWHRPVHAGDIYKCQSDGGLLYTDEPVSGSCRRIQVKITKPDPEAIARLEKWKEQRAAEEARKAAEAREERLVRVRELEALAAWQSARAALMDAQAARYCESPQPVYFPLWTYPVRNPVFYGYSSFSGYPFWYGLDANHYRQYGIPPVQLHFSRKWR
jgi:hypothetical protein